MEKPSNQVQRVMLHSKITKIFDYEFEAMEPKEFYHFGFDWIKKCWIIKKN